MNLTGAQARYQASAIATPTGTNVSGNVTIGEGLTAANFNTADVAYSLTITADSGAGDIAKLYYANGYATNTSGTVTVTDGDGLDFEGKAITLTRVYSVSYVTASGNTGNVVLANSNGLLPDIAIPKNSVEESIRPDGVTAAGNVSVSFTQTDTITITVIGKST